MKGIAYGVGVGPGDPELMTQKAIRLIRENDVIAVPGKAAKESIAYRIAAQAVPELSYKELVAVCMPMVKDRVLMEKEHRKGAERLKQYLDRGQNVVYLTLGDPSIYCSFSYLQRILMAEGYRVELVSGVPSFCAAAARLGQPLVEGNEPLHIIPAAHKAGNMPDHPGTYVLMKSASHMREVKELLRQSGLRAEAVLDCGMESERICRDTEEIPDDAGYLSLIVFKKQP